MIWVKPHFCCSLLVRCVDSFKQIEQNKNNYLRRRLESRTSRKSHVSKNKRLLCMSFASHVSKVARLEKQTKQHPKPNRNGTNNDCLLRALGEGTSVGHKNGEGPSAGNSNGRTPLADTVTSSERSRISSCTTYVRCQSVRPSVRPSVCLNHIMITRKQTDRQIV